MVGLAFGWGMTWSAEDMDRVALPSLSLGPISDQPASKRLFASPDCRIMLNNVPRFTGS